MAELNIGIMTRIMAAFATWMLSGSKVKTPKKSPSILAAWRVHLEPCWSNKAQKMGSGNIMKATL